MSTEGNQFLGHLSIGFLFISVIWIANWNPFATFAVVGYFVLLGDSFLHVRTPQERAWNFRVGAALLLFGLLTEPVVTEITALRPRTIDAELRAADLALHLDTFALSRFCLNHRWAIWALLAVYVSLALVIGLGWAASRSFVYLRAAIMGGALILVCYFLFPAVGPQYVFAGWPTTGGAFMPGGALGHPRNCMPSMHFGWALLAAINSPRRWRPYFALYAFLMAMATVATGEHYAVDVLAAIPWVLALQRVSMWMDCRVAGYRLRVARAEAAAVNDLASGEEGPRASVAPAARQSLEAQR